MNKFKVGDVVYLRITYEEGTVKEIVTDKDYFILWSTGDRGIYNESALLEVACSAMPETC